MRAYTLIPKVILVNQTPFNSSTGFVFFRVPEMRMVFLDMVTFLKLKSGLCGTHFYKN